MDEPISTPMIPTTQTQTHTSNCYKVVRVYDDEHSKSYQSLFTQPTHSPYVCEYKLGETTIPSITNSKLFVFGTLKDATHFLDFVLSYKPLYPQLQPPKHFAILWGEGTNPVTDDNLEIAYDSNEYPQYWDQLIHGVKTYNYTAYSQQSAKMWKDFLLMAIPQHTVLVDSFTPMTIVKRITHERL